MRIGLTQQLPFLRGVKTRFLAKELLGPMEEIVFLTVDITPYRGAGIELVAMGVASVCNIVANYIIGKFLVFKKAKKENRKKKTEEKENKYKMGDLGFNISIITLSKNGLNYFKKER